MSDKKGDEEIEEEDLGISQIKTPYDPSQIKIDIQTVNLGYLLDMLRHDEIDLMPDFQREGNLWNNHQMSQLMESVLLGLPLPSFYFAQIEDNKWAVVDGLQRLSAFKKFIIDEDLELRGLEFLKDYEGRKYGDLSRDNKRKIDGFKINLYEIEKQTHHDIKFWIFKRVNTGGSLLTPQEIRHALNQGVPADFIKKLAVSTSFLQATDNKVPTKRQQDRDFVNRFLAFYLLGHEDNYNGELDAFLNGAMTSLKTKTKEELKNLESVFETSMNTCFKIFGDDAFRKRYVVEDSRNAISKSLFDTLSVNIARLSDQKKKVLISKKELFKKELLNLFNDKDGKFHRSISNATAQKRNIKVRFSTIEQLLNEIIGHD